jgi:hypothetical protein
VVVLFGGAALPRASKLSDTWTWDGTDWTERTPIKSPPARVYGRLAFDAARGATILFGGDFSGLDDTWLWDGSNWTELHPVNKPPGWYTASPVPQPMVYDAVRRTVMFVGPARHATSNVGNTMETWTWNGTDWTHRSPAVTPPARDGIGLAFDSAHGIVMMAGGWSVNGSGDERSMWGWDGTNWSQLAP